MPSTEQSWSYNEKIPSDSEIAHAAIEQLIMAMEKLEWPGGDMFHVQMALEEALVNAIEHGNLRDKTKQVHVQFDLQTDHVIISIEDEGKGFDHRNVADPTEDERLDKPRGRGVHLIRELMTESSYNDIGNKLSMKKSRTPSS